MADSGHVSKSAKKNAKRRAKKAATSHPRSEETPVDHPPPAVAIATREEEPRPKTRPSKPVDPIAELKRQLEEAKAAKDHEKAQKLRQQLWVLQDTMATGTAGPGAPELDVSVLPQTAAPPPPEPETMSVSDPTAKKISKLRKKLDAINTLKEKQEKGEKLQANQLAKLEKEGELLEEIQFLEDLLRQSQLR